MQDYPITEIIDRARKGREAIYPDSSDRSSFSIHGTSLSKDCKRFATLDDILVIPPQFTPKRLEKSFELIVREPYHHDVLTKTTIGGFTTTFPLVQASMGSVDEWNKVAPLAAKACAELGLIYGIGENVVSTWGYDERENPDQPAFIERVLTYFEHRKPGFGGVVIQQNEEDAHNELWNRIYSDKRLHKYIEKGLIAFEIKGGQGAKAGMGGEKNVDYETALKMKYKGYIIHPDPEKVVQNTYERHSAADIFTAEILENRIKKLRNDYPRCKIWLKTGPYRDLLKVIQVASDAGIDNITIDGKEGGTGMSPSSALQHVGISTLSCLRQIRIARAMDIETSLVISGRITSGADLVKSIALGATGVAMGRPFFIAANAYPLAKFFIKHNLYRFPLLTKLGRKIFPPRERSIKYIKNLVETIKIETLLLTSAVGKYDTSELSIEDVASTDPYLASQLEIDTIFNTKKINYIKESIISK